MRRSEALPDHSPSPPSRAERVGVRLGEPHTPSSRRDPPPHPLGRWPARAPPSPRPLRPEGGEGHRTGGRAILARIIAQTEFEPADIPRVVALVTAVNQAVFAFAPFAFGGLHDLTGSYSAAAVVEPAARASLLSGRGTGDLPAEGR